MAQLKDSVVSGNLRVTDTTLTDTLQVTTIKAPTSSNETTYGPGTSGQVLTTNGTSTYWGAANNHTHSYIPLSGSTSVTGKIGFSAINTGIWLKDASGIQVGALVDSGSNLWIGAAQSTLRHHKGETFISSGWSGTLPTTASSSLTGNATIKISVPVYTVDANGNGSWNHTGYPVLHSGNYTSYTVKKDGTGATGSWGINVTGTSANVTGTVAIANGGTGATTRLNALKALTNESVGTSANYFLTITSSWGKGGYTSVADAKTVLGLKSAAYTESSAYLSSTTKYAGSSSVGGAATSANKLNTNAGSTNRPVYFSGGVPVQCDTPASGSWFKGVPLITTDGVMEFGKYIDFHNTNGSTADYDYRMEITTTTMTLHATGSSNTLTIKSPGNTQLSFQTTSSGKAYTSSGITCYPLTTSGMTSLFNFGGNLVIGGGESAKTLYDNNYDTIKTAENEDLYLCADNDIHIVTGCKTYADKSIIEIDALGKVYLPATGGIIVKQRSDSNYVSATAWWNGGTAPNSGEYAPQIGQHNTGGDSSYPGSICILPYKTTTNPWGGVVGLFIKKDHVYIDGVELSKSGHTHSYIPLSGSTGVTGNIEITKASGDVGFYAKRSDTGVEVWMGVGSGGTNHGIYSNKLGKWMVYGDATNVYLNGNAATATKLRSSAARTDSTVDTANTTPYQKYWVKIASSYTTGNYVDLESLWAVNDVYGNRQGILKVRARVEGTAGTFGNTRTIRWLVADSSIDVNRFAIVCYNNRKPDGTVASGTATVELWWKSTAQCASFSFVLLDETRRTGKQPNDWVLYDTSTYGQAALPTTGNITYSVAATILNSTAQTYNIAKNPSTATTYAISFGGAGESGVEAPTNGTFTTGVKDHYINDGLGYRTREGVANGTEGLSALVLGNSLASSVANNKTGYVRQYSVNKYYTDLKPNTLTASRTILLPDAAGTIAVFPAARTSGQVVVTDGTAGGVKSSGYTIAKSVPSDAKFTDENVKQSETTTNQYRPIVFGATYSTNTSELAATITGQTYVSNLLYAQPQNGMLHANIFEAGKAGTTDGEIKFYRSGSGNSGEITLKAKAQSTSGTYLLPDCGNGTYTLSIGMTQVGGTGDSLVMSNVSGIPQGTRSFKIVFKSNATSPIYSMVEIPNMGDGVDCGGLIQVGDYSDGQQGSLRIVMKGVVIRVTAGSTTGTKTFTATVSPTQKISGSSVSEFTRNVIMWKIYACC